MQFETVLINKTLLPKDVLRFHTGSNPFIYSDMFMKLMPTENLLTLKISSTSTETILKFTFPMLSETLFHLLSFGLSLRLCTITLLLFAPFSPR
jgi:hypothetical protein